MNRIPISKLPFAIILSVTFLVSAGEVRAQNEKNYLEIQAEKFKSGNIETRRDVLHKLRTDQTAQSSAVATEGLRDNTEIIRATAPFSVVYLPKDEAAAKLLPLLADKSAFVRRETAYALGETRSLLAIEPLKLLLKNDKERSVKAACAVALGKIGSPDALEVLTDVLQRKFNQRDEFIRRSAARAIGQIAFNLQNEGLIAENHRAKAQIEYRNLGEKYPIWQNVVKILLQTFKNAQEPADVKREIAFALGEIGDASAVSVLQNNLQTEDYYLAEIIRRALEQIRQTEKFPMKK